MGSRPAPAVVFYISGHGFGHAARVIEVVNALGDRRPDVAIHIRTGAARWLFDLTVKPPFTFAEVAVDVGVVQVDALTPDIAGTLRKAEAFYGESDATIAREAAALGACGAGLVVADVPPLAFAAAAAAGIGSVALSNFTWDWIYEDYERAAEIGSSISDRMRTWQRSADEAWRLPMHGGFAGFSRIRDLPLVARRSRRERLDVRDAFGWTDADVVILSSFGGVGMGPLPLEIVARTPDFRVVAAEEPTSQSGRTRSLVRTRPDGVVALDERLLYAEGWRYEDIVAAADVVVTKPGYGIIGECVANDTSMLYTSRGRFAEYDVLVGQLPRWVRSRFIERAAVLEGRWEPAVRAVLAQPPPAERPDVDGAEVAAEWIDQWLERERSAAPPRRFSSSRR